MKGKDLSMRPKALIDVAGDIRSFMSPLMPSQGEVIHPMEELVSALLCDRMNRCYVGHATTVNCLRSHQERMMLDGTFC